MLPQQQQKPNQDNQQAPQQQQDQQQHQPDQAHAATANQNGQGGLNQHPGGKDALGKKENLLAPWYDEMVAVANQLIGQFTPLGLHFRPEILLATAMQESADRDPLNARSFDNGLGLMQITPYQGKLDGAVAQAIGWDNSKGVEWNVQHSRWRDAKSNLLAGAYTMLGKARSIKGGVGKIWEDMDEAHRWRAVLFAYNAGEGSAIRALKHGGPNAPMISTFVYKGQTISHDYTAEIKGKLDYVDSHDPFGGGGGKQQPGQNTGGVAPTHAQPAQDQQKPEHHDQQPNASHPIHESVGQGGANQKRDVMAVQKRLHERGIDAGPVDGAIGPHTLAAIKEFQSTFMPVPDGLIEPGKGSEHHLFFEHGIVHPKKEQPKGNGGPQSQQGHGGGGEQHGHQVIPNDGHLSKIEPGVKLTEAIISNFRVLSPYLPAGTVMTSGLRTDEDQANLIHRYFHSHGGPASVSDAEQQREWLQNHYGMIIARVGTSPHRSGLAFDLSGAPIEEIRAAVLRCAREKANEFHFSRVIFERANNCVHVEVTH